MRVELYARGYRADRVSAPLEYPATGTTAREYTMHVRRIVIGLGSDTATQLAGIRARLTEMQKGLAALMGVSLPEKP